MRSDAERLAVRVARCELLLIELTELALAVIPTGLRSEFLNRKPDAGPASPGELKLLEIIEEMRADYNRWLDTGQV